MNFKLDLYVSVIFFRRDNQSILVVKKRKQKGIEVETQETGWATRAVKEDGTEKKGTETLLFALQN